MLRGPPRPYAATALSASLGIRCAEGESRPAHHQYVIQNLGHGPLALLGPARQYTDLQVELQLSVYRYPTGLLGYAEPDELRLRFEVVTKTKGAELHRYWTTRDRAANVRLFRLAAEVLVAIAAGAFCPNPRWAVQGVFIQEQVLGLVVKARTPILKADTELAVRALGALDPAQHAQGRENLAGLFQTSPPPS